MATKPRNRMVKTGSAKTRRAARTRQRSKPGIPAVGFRGLLSSPK